MGHKLDIRGIGGVLIGASVAIKEVQALGERRPDSVVTEEMFDGTSVTRVDVDLLEESLRADGIDLVVGQTRDPNRPVFVGRALSSARSDETLGDFCRKVREELSEILGTDVELDALECRLEDGRCAGSRQGGSERAKGKLKGDSAQ